MPLFDRLVDLEPREQRLEATPRRTFDRAELRASVRRELSHILSTRSPLPAGELIEGLPPHVRPASEIDAVGWRTSLDFGLPATVSFSPANTDDRQSLAAEVRRAIEAYEPRLSEPRVRVVDAPRGRPPRGDHLHLEIEARLLVGEIDEPISFTTVLDGELFADRNDEPPAEQPE